MLLNFAPAEVDTALLYAGPCPAIPFPDVLSHLNTLFDGVLEPFRYSPLSADASAMFAGSGLFILISKHPQSLGPQGFAQCLASPYTHMTFEDAAAAVAGHRANISIAVTHDVPTGCAGSEPKAKRGAKPPPQADGLFDMKLAICKLLTQYFCDRTKPTAIHWRQSNQILRPEHFLSLAAKRALPMPLLLHPSFFSSNWTVGGRRVIGARGCFAEHFLNRAVIFEETPMPPEWVFLRICDFVEAVRARGGDMIPDGAALDAAEAGTIRVHHVGPSEVDPAGVIYLTLEGGAAAHLVPLPKAAGFGQRLKRLFE